MLPSQSLILNGPFSLKMSNYTINLISKLGSSRSIRKISLFFLFIHPHSADQFLPSSKKQRSFFASRVLNLFLKILSIFNDRLQQKNPSLFIYTKIFFKSFWYSPASPPPLPH
ncbi:unnamed protein product [Meloidogyne enterolobii]|uniref:Uncharacterized protein n=1 Tax=Meloidogyne enterolobii TaxID=390850 RepID=A0ACB0XK66_MELEN